MNRNITQIKSISVSSIILTLLIALIIIPSSLFAQKQNGDLKYMHNETPDDPYLPMLPEDTKTSPAYCYRSSNFFTAQVNVDENGENILGDAANEPSIAIDPTNPDRIVIGWRQFDNVLSNFRQAGYGYSTDGGQTWTAPDPIDAGVFRSDPVLDFDVYGNFYYNSLTKDANSNYWCDVYKSDDGGAEWDNGTYAYGGDKQWMRIDRTDGIGNGNIYAFWNPSYSSCEPGSFTRSTDEGASYEDCDEVLGDLVWGTLAVGPDGELYTVGAYSWSNIAVSKSTTAQNPLHSTTWEQSTIVDLKGYLDGWMPVNPAGLLGQAYIDVDISDGEGRGNVYVLASVKRNNGDPCDVMFARSTDGGTTWDDPVRINTDLSLSSYQWFGTMSVAPNGRIDAVWLDTRNSLSSNIYMSELYYSYSIDQGITWSQNERLSNAFDPHIGWPNQEKMGDYFHMVSDNNGAHLAWANTLNGEQDVYYGYINPWFVGIDDETVSNNNISFFNYPNPVSDRTTLRYELHEKNMVVIEISDIYGNIVKVITNDIKEVGTHNTVFDASSLSRGIYFCRLTVGSKSEIIKLTLIK